MSDRLSVLLSPYRLPTNHPVYINEEDMAAWLNGWSMLWHPASIFLCDLLPRVDSAYDHENPRPGRIYFLPENPQQFLPDDWKYRVDECGALVVTPLPSREETLANYIQAIRNAREGEASREWFSAPELAKLLELPREQLAPFFGTGFAYAVIDGLYEATDHERLLAAEEFWHDLKQAVNALLSDNPAEVTSHLRAANEKLRYAREVISSSTLYWLDFWQLDENTTVEQAPYSLTRGLPLNVLTTAQTLHRLNEQQPALIQKLRERLDESIQPPVVEVVGGLVSEREDSILPAISQLHNLKRGRELVSELLPTNVQILMRRKSAYHPYTPALAQIAGFQRASLLAFDGAVIPSYRSAIVNWSSPDGKSLDTYCRMPSPAHKAETFFNMVTALHQATMNDSSPTLALIHEGAEAFAVYQDLLAFAELGSALGEFATMSRYLSEALAGEYAGIAPIDDFFADDLDQRVTSHKSNPVSAFPRFARLRRRFDTVASLMAIYRALGPEDPTEAELEDFRTFENEENLLEQNAPQATLSETFPNLESRVLNRLVERLQTRAEANKPGYLLLNQAPFTRRVALELTQTGAVPIEGPVKASQSDANGAKHVVEIPPLGFAWIPKTPKGTPSPRARVRNAEGNVIRNEYLEAEIDPKTGCLKVLRDLRYRIGRLGQLLVYNPGSQCVGKTLTITSAGPALGEIVTEGSLLNEQNEELATFRQRFRIWLSRPLLEIRTEINPLKPIEGYCWHAYYGSRFAWRDERIHMQRGLCGVSMQTNHSRPLSTDFIELKFPGASTAILTGGLPFVQKQGQRMLDVVMITEGETETTFELALGIDRDTWMPLASGVTAPVCCVETTKGPPHIGPSGWLFHLDAPNLHLVDLRATGEKRQFVLTLQETTGLHGGSAELRCPRNLARAYHLSGDDQPTLELPVSGDGVRLEFVGGELLRIGIELE
jgi:hypothetical protein